MDDRAFTGFEGVIILIAFVVLAAVFSYMVLGAGTITAQKEQVVYAGVGQAASSVEVVGDIYGIAAGEISSERLDHLLLTIKLTAGQHPIDISQLRVTYTDRDGRSHLTYNDSTIGSTSISRSEWGINAKLNEVTADDILEPTEQFRLIIGLPETCRRNQAFTIILQPEEGALTTIRRTVPPDLYRVNTLKL